MKSATLGQVLFVISCLVSVFFTLIIIVLASVFLFFLTLPEDSAFSTGGVDQFSNSNSFVLDQLVP